MNIHAPEPSQRGHAHDVDLEDTFDFLNTDDRENGFPIDKLPTLDDALAWFVDRGVIHREGADRVRAQAAAMDPLMARDLGRVRAVRTALREVALAISEHRAPDAGSLDDDQSGAARPAGDRARSRRRTAASWITATSATRSTTRSPG